MNPHFIPMRNPVMSALLRILHFCVVALVLAACSPEFSRSDKIDKLHLLALQAEPPEISPAASPNDPPSAWPRPADRAQLTSLVANQIHLAEPTHRSTVVYFACTPRPGDAGGNPCLSFENLTDPSEMAAAGRAQGTDPGACAGGQQGSDPALLGVGVVGAISLSGIEECDAAGCRPARLRMDANDPDSTIAMPAPTYVLPKEFCFDVFAARAPERINGLVVTILAFVVDAPPEQLIPSIADPCTAAQQFFAKLNSLPEGQTRVTATKRILVRGPEATDAPNVNPSIPGIAAAGEPLSETDATTLQASKDIDLLPLLPVDCDGKALTPDEYLQSYTKHDADGALLETKTESWSYSWFTTAGTLKKAHTLKSDVVETWTTPGSADEPIPANGRVRLYAVVRDLRGGIAWTVRDVVVQEGK